MISVLASFLAPFFPVSDPPPHSGQFLALPSSIVRTSWFILMVREPDWLFNPGQ